MGIEVSDKNMGIFQVIKNRRSKINQEQESKVGGIIKAE